MVGSFFDYLPFVLLWLATMYKLPAFLKRPRDPGRSYFWLTLASLAVALTVLLPPVYVDIDRELRVANLARLLGDGLVLIACWTAQQFLLHLSTVHGARHQNVLHQPAVLIIALLLLAAAFGSGSTTDEALDFIGRYGRSDFFIKYELIFLGYLGLTMVNVTVQSWRFASVASSPSLSVGLRTVAAGATAGVFFVLQQVYYTLTVRFGWSYPIGDPSLVTRFLAAVAIGAIVIGSTMPAWGPVFGVPRAYRWLATYRSLRRLYPLWLAVCRAAPEIALFPPPGKLADTLAVRDLDLRLYRRVIEIRDGWLALRPYFDPKVADHATKLAGEAELNDTDTIAVVDAALLRRAIAARQSGDVRDLSAVDVIAPGGDSVAKEVDVLGRIARCFERSPIVREVADRAETRHTAKTTRMVETE